MTKLIETGLLLAGVGQCILALVNLNIIRILDWKSDVERMPLLIREVFHIHTWFISITLGIFAALTCRFSHEMALGNDPVCRWLACAMGLFWAIRTTLQVAYYSSSHWRGIPSRTAVHVFLLVVYSGWAVVYLTSGLKK
jgi:hypothetical protein